MSEQIITASVLIAAVWGISVLFEKRADPRIRYALWLLVAVKLLIPVPAFESAISVMNVVNRIGEQSGMIFSRADRNANAYDAAGKMQEDGRTADSADGRTKPSQGAGTADGQTDPSYAAGAVWGKNAPLRTADAAEEDASFLRAAGAPEETAGPRRAADFLKICGYVWSIGAAVCAGAFLWSSLRFSQKLKKRRVKIGRLKNRLDVYRAAGLKSPCLFGFFRPSIYLREDSGLSKEQNIFVLAHEYTHYRHGDHIWAYVRCLCLVLYWYHPLVWLAAFRSMKDCEFACDAGTLQRIGAEKRIAYGKTLIEAAKEIGGRASRIHAPGCAAGAAGSAKEMKKRIALIAKRPRTGAAAALVLALICLGITGCTFGSAVEKMDAETAESIGETGGAQEESREIAERGEEDAAPAGPGGETAAAGDKAEVPTEAGEENGIRPEAGNIALTSDDMAYGGAVLTREPEPDKVCICVEPSVLREYLFYYYTPEGKDQEWLKRFMDSLLAENQPDAGSMKGMKETGWRIVYQGRTFMAFEGGYLYYSDSDEQGMKEYLAEAPKLCDYIGIMLREKMDYEKFDPADIEDIVSAKLDVCSMFTGQEFYSQTVTDGETLGLLEDWLGNAVYIMGGAACGNEDACLELTLADGKILRLSVATDSCSNFGINGVYYDYRPAPVWDNREFFALFDEIPWNEKP